MKILRDVIIFGDITLTTSP